MTEPVLSIVTGTYNRLAHLQAMVASARVAFPSSAIPYEFVIVDGGSEDGTLDYLRAQGDVRLIEDGELLGAISAFTRGAEVARGKYVLLANDDITFHPESIARALAFLEDNPGSGAVAFADNRPVNGYNRGYKVQSQCALLPDGKKSMVPYAQVGLFRRELGNEAGWWGAHDAIMGGARTYGGDNYLSARIWGMGYSVDAVQGAAVDDHLPDDPLRRLNYEKAAGPNGDSARFYQRFDGCPPVAMRPADTSAHKRALRFLYLPIFEASEIQHRAKRGLREALARVGLVWELDYLNTPHPAEALLSAVAAWQPDILIAQFHGARPIAQPALARARAKCPSMGVVVWNGDAYRSDDPGYIDLLKTADLFLCVDGGGLEHWRAAGVNAHYWQIGYEEPLGAAVEPRAHDVVFLANCYSEPRRALEAVLRAGPWSVGLYGQGWQQADGACLYDFDYGAMLYANCKVAIGDTFPNTRAFVSNRFFQALAAGAFLLQQEIPDFEAFNPGLKDGTHYVTWRDLDDLREKLAYWLDEKHAARRAKIAAAGQRAVQKHYSFDAQVKKLFTELLPALAEPAAQEAVHA